MQQCQALLDEPRLDTAVRAGDVYGIMIEHCAEIGHFEQVSVVTTLASCELPVIWTLPVLWLLQIVL